MSGFCFFGSLLSDTYRSWTGHQSGFENSYEQIDRKTDALKGNEKLYRAP